MSERIQQSWRGKHTWRKWKVAKPTHNYPEIPQLHQKQVLWNQKLSGGGEPIYCTHCPIPDAWSDQVLKKHVVNEPMGEWQKLYLAVLSPRFLDYIVNYLSSCLWHTKQNLVNNASQRNSLGKENCILPLWHWAGKLISSALWFLHVKNENYKNVSWRACQQFNMRKVRGAVRGRAGAPEVVSGGATLLPQQTGRLPFGRPTNLSG